MSVLINLEIGHEAVIRSKRTITGFTHDWHVFVNGIDNAPIHHYIEKVVFHLHETFPNPKRVVKELPYAVRESGYAGFTLPIDIYIKSNEEPKKIRFNYEIDLQQSGPAIIRKQKEKYVFNNPSSELREKLLKGGGVLLNSSTNESSRDISSVGDKQQLLSKPKLSSSSDIKKHKIKEHKAEDSFTDLFGTPITKTSKITLEDRIPAKSSPSDSNIKSDKSSDKSSKKSKSKHSPKDKDKDRDKEKKDKNLEKKHKEEKKSKERSKDKERKDKNGKRDRSPKPQSPSPQRRSPKRPGSPPSLPKRPPSPSPKRPPSPPIKIKTEEKKLDDALKEKVKSDSSKKKEQKDKDKEKKEHKSHKDKDKNREQKEHKSIKESKPIKEQLPDIKIKEKPSRSDDSPVVKEPEKIEKPKVDKIETIEKVEKTKHKHKKKDSKEKKEKREEKNKEKKSEKKLDKNSSLFDKMYKEDVKDSPKSIDKGSISNKSSENLSENNIREKPFTKSTLPSQLINDSSSSSLSPDESSLEAPVKIEKPEKKTKEKKEQNSEKKRKRKHDTNNVKEETQVKVDEPPTKVTREESEYSIVKDDKKDNSVDEISQDYMSILKDLQHKIMTLQDNKELQKVVQLIAETGHYEVTAKTFDFDLCALDRDTVRRLQEFFAVS